MSNREKAVIKVLPIGTEVIIKRPKQKGIITAINIRTSKRIVYEVVWWDGSNRKEEWLEEIEIKPVGKKELNRIGFKSINNE